MLIAATINNQFKAKVHRSRRLEPKSKHTSNRSVPIATKSNYVKFTTGDSFWFVCISEKTFLFNQYGFRFGLLSVFMTFLNTSYNAYILSNFWGFLLNARKIHFAVVVSKGLYASKYKGKHPTLTQYSTLCGYIQRLVWCMMVYFNIIFSYVLTDVCI